MIDVQKTITDNPFVDNLIYYSKYLALNCNIKDEEEALANETPESLKAGDLYIACVEKRAKYEMFSTVPIEILEKYIKQTSNLDLMTKTLTALTAYLNSLGLYERTNILNNLSKLAQTVYIDHYDIMVNYLKDIDLSKWITDNELLYNNCVNGLSTYVELFDIIPVYTRRRILIQYLNNYDNSNIDDINSSLNNFQEYINARVDDIISVEVENINRAMRNVFSSHYDAMVQRGYVTKTSNNNWYDYLHFTDVYDKCIKSIATYKDLFSLFPEDDLRESLLLIMDSTLVDNVIQIGVDALIDYFNKSSNAITEERILNTDMIKKYVENYNQYMNTDIYYKCKYNKIDYYELTKYIPIETQKMILNTEIEEVSNIKVYSNNKDMLNSYLNSLPKDESENIKDSITKEMLSWYVDNYEEKNNYYRMLIGLPPLYEDLDVPYYDTLVESQISITDSYKFGDRILNMIPKGIYPDSHWKAPLYTFDSYDISILTEHGILDTFIQQCKSNMFSKRYGYIRFLGDNKLDIYTCRKALNFQLIGLPTIDNISMKNKFTDTYAVNRDYILRTVYSDAYSFQSDYYNKFIIIFILVNTIMDMLAGISKMLIDRGVFDARCIKYLFESFGIPYYGDIPVKYQQAMLKNLNILIKYKSSTRNMIDICNLFGFSDIRVFGYYMLKERIVDSYSGQYVFREDNDISYNLDDLYVIDKSNGQYVDINGLRYTKLLEYRNYDQKKYVKTITVENDDGSTTTKNIINNKANVYILDRYDNAPTVSKNNDTGLYEHVGGTSGTCYYFIPLLETDYFKKIKVDTKEAELKFVKVPINETLTDYKNDPDYISTYDEIVNEDDGNTWDGGLIHEDLKQDIADYDFNAVLTKYISVETVTEMTELAFQVSYFYNMLFDNLYSEEKLTVEIPFIKAGHKFRFMDVICYLFALMYYYNGIKDNIMYSPTQILYVKGYNFNQDLNTILDDAMSFTQVDENGKKLNMEDKENIFDINASIEKDNYDYKETFKDIKIKSFNLDVDMDALDDWLNQFQMSLDDFIVYDEDEAKRNGFNQIITLRNFYSLNNSFYQKNIFVDVLLPVQYNNDIKFAFDQKLLQVNIVTDIENNTHKFVTVTGDLSEIIESVNNEIYIMDYNKHVKKDVLNHVIYHRYIQDNTGYKLYDIDCYALTDNGYICITNNGNIYVKDNDNNYTFSSDHYYKLVDEEYEEITNDINFYIDENDRKIIKLGTFYILKDSKYILNPDNCYIKATKDGKVVYLLVKDLDDYTNEEIGASSCYILHSDGHFIPLLDTDFYRKQPDGSYLYDEEICYIRTDEVTEYYDITDDPRIYYIKLTDYYAKNNYTIYTNEQYVRVTIKDNEYSYIPEKELISPDNCYFKDEYDTYSLVIKQMYYYINYNEPYDNKYIFVINSNNDYNKYAVNDNGNYIIKNDDNMRYIKDSDENYILALYTNITYEESSSMIVVFNKAISEGAVFTDDGSKYDPEKTDKVWNENDWFYEDPSYSDPSIGINGENTWYYKKPGEEITPEEDPEKTDIGSGFYLSAETYLGSNKIETGNKYYMAMDIETNFSGKLQVYCEADSDYVDSSNRVYDVTSGIRLHIDQVFTANDIETPRIKFLIYNFKDYPIEIGDYIITSNIRFMKSYNNEYIAQDIPSYDKLQELYKTNEAIYKYLVTMMQNCSDYDTYEIYKKLYDSLMTSEYNKEAFKLADGSYAKTYTDFLQTRDSVLYEKLTYFLSLDEDSMHKEIADNIIEVTYTIDDCVDTYSYGYLYSYFPAVSASYIQQYISKIINFFKSWKVHLLGINTIYRFDSPLDNTVKVLEDQEYRNRLDNQLDHVHISHAAFINPLDSSDPGGHKYSDKYSDMVKYSTRKDDTVTINDRAKIIVRDANMLKYTDNYENVHLILNNDEIKARVDNNGDLIVSNDSGLSVSIPNNLIYSNDENDQDVFGNQNIGDVNKDSMDII